MSKQNRKFFVYGTLKEGGYFARHFDRLRKSATPGRVEGVDMLDLGGFPGAIPGEGTILGEVHEYEKEEEVLRGFDDIEGYNERAPEASLYIRKEVDVVLEDGSKVKASMYFFNRESKGRKFVENGVWDISR